MSIAAVQYR